MVANCGRGVVDDKKVKIVLQAYKASRPPAPLEEVVNHENEGVIWRSSENTLMMLIIKQNGLRHFVV